MSRRQRRHGRAGCGASPSRIGVLSQVRPGPVATEPPRLNIGALALRWHFALDANERALLAAAADRSLASTELTARAWPRPRAGTGGVRTLRHRLDSRGRPAPWLSPVPVTNRMLGLPGRRARMPLRPRRRPHRQRRPARLGLGEVFDDFLLRLTEKTGWHFIPFDRRHRLPRLTSTGARGSKASTLSSAAAESVCREGRTTTSPRPIPPTAGQAEGRGARARVAPARRDGPRRRPSLSGGRGPCRTEARRRLGQHEHVADARTRGAGDASSTSASTPMSSAPRACAPVPPRTCSLSPAAASASARGGRHVHAQRGRGRRRSCGGLTVIGVGDGDDAEMLSGFGAERVVPAAERAARPTTPRGTRLTHAGQAPVESTTRDTVAYATSCSTCLRTARSIQPSLLDHPARDAR